MLWVLDLDGVIWLSGQPIAGSAAAAGRLRAAGHNLLFVTNNSGPTRADHLGRLKDVGIPAADAELVTSAQAAAELVPPGAKVSVIGGAGIIEALERRGAQLVGPQSDPDHIVVGRTTNLDYELLAASATAVRNGAGFIASNTDPTYPTPAGPQPGAGAIIAFVQVASGVTPKVAGKPHAPIAQLIARLYGSVEIAVGDRPDTDGEFAQVLGARFALVLSGSTSAKDLPVLPEPDVIGENLAAVVDDALGKF